MNFKDYFKLPLRLVCGFMVFSENSQKVFDFLVDLTEEQRQQCLDIINGIAAPIVKRNYQYVNGVVYMNETPFIRLRGWGYLTGTGGKNLSAEDAVEIQNQLGNYIVDKLTLK